MNLHNLIAERNILGILMNHPDWIHSIKNLKADYFYNKTHSIIFYTIDKAYNDIKGDTMDPDMVISYARDLNVAFEEEIEKSGGLDYLMTVQEVSTEYTKKDLVAQADIVVTLSYLRDEKRYMEDMIDFIDNGEHKTIADVRKLKQDKSNAVTNKYTIRDSYNWLGSVIDEVLDKMKENIHDGVVGYPTRIPALSKYMTYRPGELVIYGARAKFGKSNWAINEVHSLAVEKNIPILYLDTEMQTGTFLTRLIAIDSQLPIREIETLSYLQDPKKKEVVEKSIERIKKAPIIHKYSNSWTRQKVRDDVISLYRKNKIQVLIYDYIKIKEVQTGAEHNELGNWAIFLKDLAGEINIPIISMAQMSPYEIRLADSDKLNRYASTIAFLLPLDNNARNRMKQWGYQDCKDYIHVAYNRNGPQMNNKMKGVYVEYDRERATFKECKYQEPIQDLMT